MATPNDSKETVAQALVHAAEEYEQGRPVMVRLASLGNSALHTLARKPNERLADEQKLERAKLMKSVLNNEEGTGLFQAELMLCKWFEMTFRLPGAPISDKSQWRDAYKRGFTDKSWGTTKRNYREFKQHRGQLLDEFYRCVTSNDSSVFTNDFPEVVMTMDSMNHQLWSSSLERENPNVPPADEQIHSAPTSLIPQLNAALDAYVLDTLPEDLHAV